MKKKMIHFIAVACVLFLNGCSSDVFTEETRTDNSGMTRARQDQPTEPEPSNPFDPGIDSSFPGVGSYHWTCPSCRFLNSFFQGNCIVCGAKNPTPNTHQNPPSSGGNPDPYNPITIPPVTNSPVWYDHPDAQKYYTIATKSYQYQYDSNYADGVDYTWFAMVKIMKPYDKYVTILKCKSFINSILPNAGGSYERGCIDGAKAAISSYNEFAAETISPLEISDELEAILP